MYPYLFEFQAFGTLIKVPAYGILLAAAFTTAYIVGLRRAIKLGEEPRHAENLFLILVFSSVVGSRLFHVLFEERDYYIANPGKILAVGEGGYTLYGAMLTGMLGIYLYTRRNKLNYRQWGDIAAPGTAIGIAIGRTGCLLAGCCWGKPTGGGWGVVFRHPETFSGVKGIPLHPSQMYEAFGGLLIFLYLQWRFRSRRYAGQIFFEGLIAYAIVRYIVEFFRGDEYRGYVLGGWVSYSQLVSLLILPVALAGIYWFSRRPTASR